MNKKPFGGDIPENEPVFTSGVMSRLLGVPVWVLKQLDREKLVCPKRLNKQCTRLYSYTEYKKVKKVWHYMSVKKVNVHGVKAMIEINEVFFDV